MNDDAAEIKRALTDRLEEVLSKLFSGWVQHKGHAWPAFVSAKDPGSFQVYLRDCKEGERGHWYRRSAGIGGDVINLVAYGVTRNHKRYEAAFEWAREFLGMQRTASPERSAEYEQERLVAEEKRKEEQRLRQEAIAADRELDAAEARGLWNEVRRVDETGAEIYLAGVRKIGKPPCGWPDTLGFHPELHHRFLNRRFPAMVARIQDVGGETVAISAVFLTPGSFTKIDIEGENSKLTYGPMGGGAVRFGGAAPAIETCEGVETGLAVWHLVKFERPVWPCLTTSGVKGVEFPLEIQRVRHWPDGEPAIRKQKGGAYELIECGPGLQAGRALGERVRGSGMGFALNDAPGGGLSKMDYLDVYVAVKQNVEA